MEMTIAEDAFTLDGVKIPETATKAEWMDVHKKILLCKRASAKWLKQSRDFAVKRWGMAFVADSEVQLEMDLGVALEDEKPRMNPDGKSISLVTIEGISMSFELWHRKASDDIKTWDKEKIEKAINLLSPIADKVAELRALL